MYPVALSLFIGVFISLTGCSSVELKPEGNRVRIVQTPPQQCLFVGEVVGDPGNALRTALSNAMNIELGARNALVNETVQRGADTVLLLSRRVEQATQRAGQSNRGGAEVLYLGHAYRCDDGVVAYR
jgi:hypothetical protein